LARGEVRVAKKKQRTTKGKRAAKKGTRTGRGPQLVNRGGGIFSEVPGLRTKLIEIVRKAVADARNYPEGTVALATLQNVVERAVLCADFQSIHRNATGVDETINVVAGINTAYTDRNDPAKWGNTANSLMHGH
jgi:hypothetical protein